MDRTLYVSVILNYILSSLKQQQHNLSVCELIIITHTHNILVTGSWADICACD